MSASTPTCPACGGSGGGPFGPAGSAWDVESYMCLRCAGRGVIGADGPALTSAIRPLAKGQAPAAAATPARRLAHTRPASKRTRSAAAGLKKQ